MSKKFVPYAKMSKKQRKKYNKAKRKMWEFNPATRKSKGQHEYKRRKEELQGV